MDNEKKELSANEMEQAGGGSENTSAEPEKKGMTTAQDRIETAIRNIAKGAYRWFTQLFSGDD